MFSTFCSSSTFKRSAQMQFPQPKRRLWTWLSPKGNKQQIDHILINSKWNNSLENCRAYSSVNVESDHRIVSVTAKLSLRSNKDRTKKTPRINWNDLNKNIPLQNKYAVEVSNQFNLLCIQDPDIDTNTKYNRFLDCIENANDKVLNKCCPRKKENWVSNKTENIRIERENAKKKHRITRRRSSC